MRAPGCPRTCTGIFGRPRRAVHATDLLVPLIMVSGSIARAPRAGSPRDWIARIALVSHAWHLPRAVPLFEKQGIEVIPAPTGFSNPAPTAMTDFLPGGLAQSRDALNEYLGQLYNRLKEPK